ncbi:MAG: aldo/keto reductase [Anaerolineae bacterium]|nr:aldo/keto reductase [Anaerolineae bacterium]
MEIRKLGRTGLKISELCLGTMTFGWIDEADSLAIMDRAWEAGINCFDTADIYSRWIEGNVGGESETVIGKWLRGKPREQVVLATKVRGRMWDGPNGEGLSRAHIMAAVEGSLRRLGTDYIDLYQVHWPDDDTPLDETQRALDDLVTQGKVRYLGASNHRAWRLTKALWVSDKHGYARYDCLQPHYHLLKRPEVEPDLRDLCLDQGIGLIPYSPLAGGFLTGKYTRGHIPPGSRGETFSSIKNYMTDQGFAVVERLGELGAARGKTTAQMALGWLLTLPHVTAPIIGARTVAQLEESLGAAGLRLRADEMAQLDDLTAVAGG